MKTLKLFKIITWVLGCAALAMTTTPVNAGVIKAHAGTTFNLTSVAFDANGNPTTFTHTVDGVVRVSVLGNCTFHADVIVGVPKIAQNRIALGDSRVTHEIHERLKD